MKILLTGGSGFIGTNLLKALNELGAVTMNIDIAPPLDPSQSHIWTKCDILNSDKMKHFFHSFQPEAVIHLAARTDCDEQTTVEEGYSVNTVGTGNVLEAVKSTPSVERVIVTSSQYVCGPGHTPKHDQDFAPHTVYGESKAESETITRQAGLSCIWTIVRPTNIWGPWHMRYRREFWRIVKKGFYLHPGGPPVVRSYGYVGNVAWQLTSLLEQPADRVNEKVFYLGDPPGDIFEWTNAFSLSLRGKPVRKVPRSLLFALGAAGSILQLIGLKASITMPRYRSMTTDYPTDTNRTDSLLGSPPYSLQQGVEETVKWLTEHDEANE